MTQWSEENGGFLSIGARSQASFMNNVYELLFGKSDWKNTIANITVDERVTTEYGEIYLSKTDPKLFGFGDFEIVYILERTGNALVFKKINDEFKLVAMMYTGEGD
ncbi:MAG: hypothetical protein IPG02_17315 [Ignavibacteria bacterium]|nr:hypothetical protein [Ignavibacteria bacterium]